FSQRRAGRLTATNTHLLAQGPHKQKVHGRGDGVKGRNRQGQNRWAAWTATVQSNCFLETSVGHEKTCNTEERSKQRIVVSGSGSNSEPAYGISVPPLPPSLRVEGFLAFADLKFCP